MGRSRSASWCGWIGPRCRRAARSRRPAAPWRRRCRVRRPAPRPAGRRPRSMLQAAANAFRLPDVRRKLLFTFGILIIYRISAAIPVPSFDRAAFQNLQPVIPRLEEMMREGGEAGRQRLNQITRIVTVPLAMLQALGQGALLATAGAIKDFGLFDARTVLPTLAFLITTAAGTMFLIWLGELITENGIGNGVSIIIFAGIIARVPSLVGSEAQNNVGTIVIMAIVSALVIAAIVFVQQAQRRIPVQYAKRVVGRRVMQGQSTFIPIPVNMAGMIPLIFAISIVTAPYIISSYFVFWTKGIWHGIANFFYTVFAYNSTSPVYWIIYFVLVVGFTYFYTYIQFHQQRLPETLQ